MDTLVVGDVHLLWIGFLSVCGCVCALHYCFCYRLFVVVVLLRFVHRLAVILQHMQGEILLDSSNGASSPVVGLLHHRLQLCCYSVIVVGAHWGRAVGGSNARTNVV